MEEEEASSCKHSGIVHSLQSKPEYISGQVNEEHGLCYILAGELSVAEAASSKSYGSGELIFFRKNHFAKFRKSPANGQNFKSITVVFDTAMLKAFNADKPVAPGFPPKVTAAVIPLNGELTLMQHYFQSLFYYFDTALPQGLMELKVREALMLLLQIDPALKNILFDFGQPGKINLEAFMHQHFRFNVETNKLAYLSGRSLASFKRDFTKTFGSTPRRWLHKRRLEEAYFQIKEHHRRPSEVYHEVGFETISHFSASFKQHFGINPSALN